jgi:predicted nucleotidyltransferase
MDIQKEIENISSQIIAKYKPEKVILFGSAARGEATPDSDLDFSYQEDTPYYGADRIRELSRIDRQERSVDFLVYRPEEWEQRMQWGIPSSSSSCGRKGPLWLTPNRPNGWQKRTRISRSHRSSYGGKPFHPQICFIPASG